MPPWIWTHSGFWPCYRRTYRTRNIVRFDCVHSRAQGCWCVKLPAECTALLFPAAVTPSLPARHVWQLCALVSFASFLLVPFFMSLGVSPTRLWKMIFVGTLLPLASHKSAVVTWLFSQRKLLTGLPSLWGLLSLGALYSHRAFWGSVNAKGTHTWSRINNLYLAVSVRNTGLGLCWVYEATLGK